MSAKSAHKNRLLEGLALVGLDHNLGQASIMVAAGRAWDRRLTAGPAERSEASCGAR